MPDQRTHRGAHPEDATLFAPSQWPALQRASDDLAWLLDRGYALRSSLALVGDRHGLTQRQRLALARSTATVSQCDQRAQREVSARELGGRRLWIDGYNLLITVEAALSGGVILRGRDGCYRDMASLHGGYRHVEETQPALELVGRWLQAHAVERARWILDRPVGNSGRLAQRLETTARTFDWPWEVALEASPDVVLAGVPDVVASSDSVVLDRCGPWCNVARGVVDGLIPAAQVLALGGANG